jgi:hypothetical protein
MTDFDLDKLLGSSAPDAGCDESGELMEEYCELVLGGEPIPPRFASFLAHMTNCAACREDAEGLVAALRALDDSDAR